MTTEQIINLDCRKEENKKIIQNALRKIKPFTKYSDDESIPFYLIEKAVEIMCKNYTTKIKEIKPDSSANDNHIIWRAVLTDELSLTDFAIVYGLNLYELYAKIAIRLYAKIKLGK